MMLSFVPDGVLFDCDSTLSSVEGIDELARWAGCHEEVAKLTDAAMSGSITLEQVYSRRLDLIRPQKEDIRHLAALYLEHITRGAHETIATLKARHIPVGIVSGGLRDAILPLAKHLGIAAADVYAVSLDFDADGRYHNVAASALTTADGKHDIVTAWRKKHHLNKVVLIGDGASDVAALGAARAVIGYGGIVRRDNVATSATVFYDGADLRGILPLLGISS